ARAGSGAWRTSSRTSGSRSSSTITTRTGRGSGGSGWRAEGEWWNGTSVRSSSWRRSTPSTGVNRRRARSSSSRSSAVSSGGPGSARRPDPPAPAVARRRTGAWHRPRPRRAPPHSRRPASASARSGGQAPGRVRNGGESARRAGSRSWTLSQLCVERERRGQAPTSAADPPGRRDGARVRAWLARASSDVGEDAGQRLRGAGEVDRLDEDPGIAQLAAVGAAHEAAQLCLDRPPSPGGLLLERPEGSQVAVFREQRLDARRAHRPYQLVLEIRVADEEAEPLHSGARGPRPPRTRPEPGPLERPAEVTFLARVAEARDRQPEPVRTEALERPPDRLRSADRHDRDAFRRQVAAKTSGERLERDPVADPFGEDDRPRGRRDGQRRQTSGLSALDGTRSSSSTARSASTQSIPIAVRVVTVADPMWGASTTFSSPSSASVTSGPRSKTSSAAPPGRPAARAAASAASSTIGPRLVLTRTASGFISESARASIRCLDSGVSGRCSDTTSARASRSSSGSPPRRL